MPFTCRTCRRELQAEDARFCPFCGAAFYDGDDPRAEYEDDLAATAIIPSKPLRDALAVDMDDEWIAPGSSGVRWPWLTAGALALVLSTWFVTHATSSDSRQSSAVAAHTGSAVELASQPERAEPATTRFTGDGKSAESIPVKGDVARGNTKHHRRSPASRTRARRLSSEVSAQTESIRGDVQADDSMHTEPAADHDTMRGEPPAGDESARLEDAARALASIQATLTEDSPDAATGEAVAPATDGAVAPETDGAVAPETDGAVVAEADTEEAEPHADTDADSNARQDASRAEFFVKLGDAQLDRDDHAQASISFARALALDPTNQAAKEGLREANRRAR